MRLPLFLVALTAVFMCPAFVMAEADPAPPPGNTATAPTTPTAPADPGAESGAKPAARKEDDDATTAGMLARIKAYAKGQTGMANENTGLQKKLSTAEATIKERDKRIADLEADNKKMSEDLAAVAAWLSANGHADTTEAAADPGKAFQTAVGASVANEVRKIGVPAATVKTTPAAGAGSADSLREAFRAEKDPEKKAALFQQIKRADAAAKSRAN